LSRGLGKVERRILEALQATTQPYVSLSALILLIDGQLSTLDDETHYWRFPICEPHPSRRLAIGLWVDHDASCYPPTPRPSMRETVYRAVRSLARKGLVRCEYDGWGRPKRLLVCLPSTDPVQLPNGAREEQEMQEFIKYGRKPPYRRPGTRKRWYVDNQTLNKE
jgi:hypothetical protein